MLWDYESISKVIRLPAEEIWKDFMEEMGFPLGLKRNSVFMASNEQ